ncbi:hypothetical protein IQ266_15660 [filamentous cyanobacterium LEGE 11480]|uniref:Uncharacterized protein n=1 Tax=Romeriopsis navalis LEGE 11480 TaxID=2777977 RepID=A0A928Z362_9CYAN|nr:hypothetical protein [Romeriopsis navalis]MBE9031171.1 hypothetical protein [Romeriopsis navalis LEGE 11480]
MPVHPQGINRLFWAMTVVLFAGLLGMGCMEIFLLQPLRQSIADGVVGSEVNLTLFQTRID